MTRQIDLIAHCSPQIAQLHRKHQRWRYNSICALLRHSKGPEAIAPMALEVDVIAVRIDDNHGEFNSEDRMPEPSEIMGFCLSLVSLV